MGKRQESRDRVERQIVELGRRHLATSGAAGLSLRAIARELGMVSSAVYRYVASRDELLTLLLVEAYDELADAVDEARAGTAGSWAARIAAMAQAARRWALTDPAGWSLLYGSPVPGYRAPPDRTVGPGTRVVGALFAVVASGLADGSLTSAGADVDPALSADFDGIRAEFGFPGDDAVVAKCLLLWSGIVGAISLEVFGQYGADTFTRPECAFDVQLGLLIDVLN